MTSERITGILFRMSKKAFLSIIGLHSIIGIAQNNTAQIEGRIIASDSTELYGALVYLLNTEKGTQCNDNGYFNIKEITPGNYIVIISSLGYKTDSVQVLLNPGQKLLLNKTLEIQDHAHVEIVSKNEIETLKDDAIKAEVIDTKNIQQEASTLTELINRSAGVRVRQMGGLGSSANVMINGYQGKAVKYFKDGIPLDYLGAGFNVNLVPVNMLDRLEIYKGVLPVKLGADALGGGLNMVTKQSLTKYLDVSYEAGSFNTHRASLNIYHRDTTHKFFVGLDAFFNHSDNSYKVIAKVTDPDTRNRSEQQVKRFHDDFTNYYTELYGGAAHTKWADQLRIGVTYFRYEKEEQHGALMTTPYGQVTSSQSSIFPTLRYTKTLLKGKLNVDQFLVYNSILTQRVDTCHCTYDWYGNKIPAPSKQGEVDSDGSLLKLTFNNFISRTHLSYRLHHNHTLQFNTVYSSYSRIGSDPFGNKYMYSGRDILSVQANYTKWISALGIESMLFQRRITNNLIVKYYRFRTNGTDSDFTSATENQITSSGQRYGIADAIKVSITPSTFVRISGELATRLPEQSEIFGDGLFAVSNFDLKPEQSLNLNLGLRTSSKGKHTFEINTFYRHAKDLIIQVPYNLLFLQYQNVDQVKGMGAELDAQISVLKWLSVNGNITYQDLRLTGIKDQSVLFLEGARVRNTPYFFGNLGLKTSFTSLLAKHDKLQAYWYFNYMHEYYLETVPKNREAGGFLGLAKNTRIDSDLIIPTQFLHTIGFNYSILHEKISVGFEIKNLLNANLYDNFRVQKAGRSFHIKLRYVIK